MYEKYNLWNQYIIWHCSHTDSDEICMIHVVADFYFYIKGLTETNAVCLLVLSILFVVWNLSQPYEKTALKKIL